MINQRFPIDMYGGYHEIHSGYIAVVIVFILKNMVKNQVDRDHWLAMT